MIDAAWKRILLIAPHPDDESLATGGLILRSRSLGAEVRILYLTDGERNGWPQHFIERRVMIRASDRERWAHRRRAEALAALAMLDVPPGSASFLGLPDGGLGSLRGPRRDRAAADVAAAIERFQPNLVLRPCTDDLHGDHRAAADMVREALSRLGESAAAAGELAYLVHGHPGPGRVALRLDLDVEERARKLAAIGCHASQLVLSRARFTSYASRSEVFYEPAMTRPPRFATLWRVWEIVSSSGPRSAH